jgi:hypothetical protein
MVLEKKIFKETHVKMVYPIHCEPLPNATPGALYYVRKLSGKSELL